MPETEAKIAIVGSGPSGCYSAQFLRKAWPKAEITIFDSLPVPYGLVRYGVAADHQGSKAVIDQFDRLFERESVAFAGNIKIGADLDFETLSRAFDVVVAATGLPHDRPLVLDGDAGRSLIGAGALVRALNGHPDMDLPCAPDNRPRPLGSRIAIIGNGNVAMDAVRLLAKPLELFTGSDIDDERLRAVRASGVEEIDVFGRSAIQEAKFDLAMFKEIMALPNVGICFSGASEDDDCPALASIRDMTVQKPAGAVKVHFHFRATPRALRKAANGFLLTFDQHSGLHERAFDTVVTATGFVDTRAAGDPCSGASWTGRNVFRVGWLQNGGQGTVAANRKSAKAVTDAIVAAVRSGDLLLGAPGFAAVASQIQHRRVDYAGWQRIDADERARCGPDRLRRKISDRSTMLAIALAGTTLAASKTA
jgi:ferredoxin--NADP+ reductase